MDEPNGINVTKGKIIPIPPTLATNDTQVGNFADENPEKARWVLLWLALVLAFISFIAFLITRDYQALVGVMPILIVYGFYFPRKKLH